MSREKKIEEMDKDILVTSMFAMLVEAELCNTMVNLIVASAERR